MKRILSIGLLMVTVITACKKDEPAPDTPSEPDVADLSINLHAWFEGEALVAGETYHNASNYRVNVSDLKVYLSHVYAVKENGDTVDLSEVAFFDLTDGSDALILGNIPVDSYTGFGFGIGVPPELNSPGNPDFNIALFDSNHPLSITNNMYWSWATGYRFVIFDGKYNTDPDGSDPLLNGYSFHTGKDESYRQADFTDLDFTVTSDGAAGINLDLNVDRFYYNASDTIDLAVDNQTHGTNLELSNRLSDLIVEAIEFRP